LTPLLVAANNGHEAMVQQLLQRPDINPNSKLSDGTTSLMLATQRGYDNVGMTILTIEETEASTVLQSSIRRVENK
jgi:ankyrin repeat protein